MVTVNLLPDLMKTRLWVSDILGTYALPERRSVRIRRLAEERFRDRPDLAALYCYIDDLVEQGLRPEDFFHRITHDIPAPAPGPEEAAQRGEGEQALSFAELARRLEDSVGPGQAEVFESLLMGMGARPDHPSPVTDRELADRLAQVRRRLERLADRVARTGVLVPTRRVGRVSFMGRHLFEIRGRYVAKVTDDVAERIFEAHQRGMSLAEAARHAGVSRDTVRRWWSRAGKEPHCRPCNESTAAVVASIMDGYRRHRGDARKTAEAHGVSLSTVYRYWKRAGLTRARPAAPLGAKAQADLRAAHGAHGGNATAAARALGLSPSTVRKYWKKAGLAPRKPGRPPGP